MSKISAQVIAHSKNEFGDELITFVTTGPRIILAELNTHRMFSRNSASSRAIPFPKMLDTIKNNPFIPIAFQEDHKGMQGIKYLTGTDAMAAKHAWLIARDYAAIRAEEFAYLDVTKQLVNRLLEPFMWHTCIITTGKEGLENFFDLRCPTYNISRTLFGAKQTRFRSRKEAIAYTKGTEQSLENISDLQWLQINEGQAEIHMMALAEAMYDTYNESKPESLKAGEWHIPYKKQIEEQFNYSSTWSLVGSFVPSAAYISSVMCARVSYTVAGHDLTEWTFEKYIDKAFALAEAKPLHASPFEHCSYTMNENEYKNVFAGNDFKQDGWCKNFRGFVQLRHILENKQYYK